MLPILPKKEQKRQVSKKKTTAGRSIGATRLGVFLVIAGISLFLAFQGIPLVFAAVEDTFFSENHESFIPISDTFLKQLTETVYYDPGRDYFDSLIKQAPESVAIDMNYSKEMRISIASANIKNIKLFPNVPGSDTAIYDSYLKKGVAHLKGTSLPGDGGTAVIYGHSGYAGILGNHNNPQIIFSRLEKVSVGDSIAIEKDGNSLHYIVSSKKTVVPEDIDFFTESSAKDRIVLLTCWPLGIGTKRLVIIGERHE